MVNRIKCFWRSIKTKLVSKTSSRAFQILSFEKEIYVCIEYFS